MHYLLTGISLSLFWLLLSGYFSNILLLCFGVFSVALALYFDRHIRTKYPLNTPSSLVKNIPKFAKWLVFEVIKANIAVVKNIWSPQKNPISPTLAELDMRQHSALGQTIFANSITLTPGTVSFDVKNGKVQVHAIVEEAIIELQDGEMNQRVADLELDR
ncbi:MAG: Na+/H+ antiporter subunit E [Acidiferrobacterales bacterium]|nr:Na+/H+ antiporter subunit E [Acidiferrobacterales bacterium]